MHLTIALAAAASLATMAVPNAAQALTWNWSFTTSEPSVSGSGTFTTADAVPAPSVTYQITDISGTYNRAGASYTITDLMSAANQFRWNGTPASPILVNAYDNIGFNLAGGGLVLLNNNYSGFFTPVVAALTPFVTGNVGDGVITSSLLSPVTPPAPVPGPLPLLGAGAAFVWSRRLRRRLKSGSLKAASLQ